MSHHEGVAGEAHAHGWHYSVPPFLISVGICVLTIAFSFQFVYHSPFAAVICLGLAVPLILGGVVGWVNEAMGGGEGLSYAAMGWFILAEAMIFLGMFASYWFMRLEAPVWPPAGTPAIPTLLPLVMTATLVASSLTIHHGESLLHRGDHGGFTRWLLLTIVLGAAFLGMSAYEWSHLIGEGFTTATNVYGTVFFSITGFHGAHVLIGVSIFLAGLPSALKAKPSLGFVRTAGLYWHFVDIIWFFVVSQVYFW
ncbi:MAG: heme-copper oxidase subunit III [Rhodocyclaceae bacterium]